MKNWALATMWNALPLVHFSSALLLKEQMIIAVKKNVKQRWSYRPKNWVNFSEICQKKIQWNRPIFLRIWPWKSFEIWILSAKIPRNQPIFPRILTFFPRNRPIFPWICPWKSREILLFFPWNIRSPELMKKS